MKVWMLTDDPEEAFRELRLKRATGESGWDMADVRTLPDPLRTIFRYIVFRADDAA